MNTTPSRSASGSEASHSAFASATTASSCAAVSSATGCADDSGAAVRRQRPVVVRDRHDAGRGSQRGPGRVREHDLERLVALVRAVGEHVDLDRHRGDARRERERPGGRLVVRAGGRGQVRRRPLHGHGRRGGRGERDRQRRHRRADVALGDADAADRERGRRLHVVVRDRDGGARRRQLEAGRAREVDRERLVRPPRRCRRAASA